MRKAFREIKALFAFARLAYNVDKLDRVFNMRDAAADPKYLAELQRKLSTVMPNLADFHRARVRLTINRAELAALPKGTLGRTYADFLTENNLKPEAFPENAIQSEPDYMRTHFYETHDLWHVVTGFDTTPTGEAGVQAFYAAQTFGVLPAALLSALLLNAAIKRDDVAMKARVGAIAAGWALGERANILIGYPWNERFTWTLADCRKEIGIDTSVAGPGMSPQLRIAA